MNRRMLGVIAAAAIVAAPLAACGEPVVGTVISKDYDDADTIHTTKQECTTTTTGSGTSKKTKRTCRKVPTTKREAAEWELVVQTTDGVREVDVSERVFNRVKVGDRFDSSVKR